MYIKNVKISNYRGFRDYSVDLNKITLLVGENDVGKSNFFKALALPLNRNQYDFSTKRLNVADINQKCIQEFFDSIISEESIDIQKEKIPKVEVILQFSDPQGYYEMEILRKWLIDDNGEDVFEIKYAFVPKNDNDFIEIVKDHIKKVGKNELKWFTLPIDCYEYCICSTNNEKSLTYNDLKNLCINYIDAERDNFSEANNSRSNNLLSKLLINNLNNEEKSDISVAYSKFFNSFEETTTFKQVLNYDHDLSNIHDFLNKIVCIPNLPNLKSILSNITLGYGEEFLYQKGLGERNLVLLFLLFANFKNLKGSFNLCCIEEPEAHLSINNLNLAIDFLFKSTDASDSLLQTLISSHNPTVINKLKMKNVVVLTDNEAVSFSDIDDKLVNYLRKRPNFDILKLLFSRKTVLVEGPTEEMFINAIILKNYTELNDINVISIGQKGYRTFFDIWLLINKNNLDKKIGVIRDFDDQPKAKSDHDMYDEKYENIIVRTTENYTLEDDLVRTGNNCTELSKLFGIKNDPKCVSDHIKNGKTDGMLTICNEIISEEQEYEIEIPKHINEVLEKMK